MWIRPLTGTWARVMPQLPFVFNQGKSDGFNLNRAKVRIDKPLTEENWAAGYRLDLWFGPDAELFGTHHSRGVPGSEDFAIQQAYVALRAPVGNGLDFKMGVFDTVIGYESHDNVNNPNYTRSWGYTIEPSTHTGLLATYQVMESLGVSVGVANTASPRINDRAQFGVQADNALGLPEGANAQAESYKTYMGSVALTAPESMGFLQGSTLYAGVVNGFHSFNGGNQANYYLGATLATPVKGVKVGAAFDYRDLHQDIGATTFDSSDWAASLYASFAATEKLSFHARGEYFRPRSSEEIAGVQTVGKDKIFAVTGTVQYDLWKNVLTRLEIRWDHDARAQALPGSEKKNEVLVAGNVIYKF